MANTKIKAAQFSGVIGNGTDGYILQSSGNGDMEWVANIVNPTVTSVSYPGDDTAADPAGGQTVTITGADFKTGASVTIGGTAAPSVSFVSATTLTITTPAKAAGDYDVVVTNVDGGISTKINGISYNGVPAWTTAAGSLGTFASDTTISTITLQASEPDAGTITFDITNGTLPTGLSLTGADIDGTTTLETADTLYTFTVTATDDENQSTPRTFTITVTKQFINTENFTINTYTGTGSTQSIEGKIGTAASFNGSSSKIELSGSAGLTFGSSASYSLSFWLNTNSLSSFRRLFSNILGITTENQTQIGINTDGSLWIYRTLGTSNAGFAQIESKRTSGIISINTWHYVTVVMDNGVHTVYIDGALRTLTSNSNTQTPSVSNTTFGTDGNNLDYYNGKLDQVRLFNKALSSSEVTTLYGEPSNPSTASTTDIFDDGSGIALYEFEKGAKDTGGVSGYIGSSGGIFNGSSSYILLNGINSANFTPTSYTVSAWFKTTATDDSIFSTDAGGSPISDRTRIHVNSSGYIEYEPLTISNKITSSITVNDGNWHFVAVSTDSSGNTKLYVDNQPAVTGTGGGIHFRSETWIGCTDTAVYSTITRNNFFNGKIDQVRIFNKAISSSEVTTLYQETSASATKSTTDIFDDGSGVVLYELEGNANDTGLPLAEYTPIANRTFESFLSTSSQSTAPRDFEFNSDGTKLFFCDGSNNRIHQYTMTTAWDVSTASHNGYYDVTGQISGGAFPISVQFKNDGTKMYVSTYGGSPERIYEYDLSSAYVVTSGVSYNSKFGNVTVQAWGMEFNSTGTILICSSDSASGNLCKYTLSTAWDISTISLSQQVTLSFIKGIDLSPDGKQLLGAEFPSGDKKIKSYSLSTAYDITTLTQREEWNVNSIENVLQTVTCKFDTNNKIDKLYFVGFQQDTIYGYDIDETADFLIQYNGTATNVSYAYDGTPTNVSFVGTSFQPDLVWIKKRSGAQVHNLYDSVRGISKVIYSDLGNAEATVSSISSFDTNGITLGNGGGDTNASNETYVSWMWKAADNTTTISAGTVGNTIASDVRANQGAGFSIVKYTGSDGTKTVGHGLSSAPEMIIIKSTTSSAAWRVYHTSVGNTKALELNGTSAEFSFANWNNTSPTSSLFTVKGSSVDGTWVNGTGNNYIAYCFHSVDGYQKIGSYTGTGSAGNTVTGLGFQPRFLMIKNTNGYEWVVKDSLRGADNELYPNSSGAENTIADPSDITFNSDGFTMNNPEGATNQNNATIIYLAIA